MRTEEIVDLVGSVSWELGYSARQAEERRWWKALADRVVSGVSYEELIQLDEEYAVGLPCNVLHARGCSRCIRAAAVARRGGDYTGGHVEWENP